MYKRIIYENWHNWVPFISFAFTFAFFAAMALRGLFLRKEKATQMAHLPLDDKPAGK